MNAKKLLILALFTLSFLLTSCSTYYYFPFRQNTLNFEEKGDVSVAFGTDGTFTHRHIGGAITNNIGIVLDNNSDRNGNYSITDIELVLYNKFKSNFLTELNLGYGLGKINWKHKEIIRFKANRPYIQPAIGYSHKYFELGVSSRFSYLEHKIVVPKDFNSDATYYLNTWTEAFDVGTESFTFFEPAFSIAGKFKGFKLQFQNVEVKQLSSNKIKYINSTGNITLSYKLNLNKLLKK